MRSGIFEGKVRHRRLSPLPYDFTYRIFMLYLDLPVLEKTYGKAESRRWFQRWRMFFMACAELFGFPSPITCLSERAEAAFELTTGGCGTRNVDPIEFRQSKKVIRHESTRS